MKKTLFITTLALALAGCAGGQPADDKGIYRPRRQGQGRNQTRPISPAYVWRDTEKFLTQPLTRR